MSHWSQPTKRHPKCDRKDHKRGGFCPICSMLESMDTHVKAKLAENGDAYLGDGPDYDLPVSVRRIHARQTV